MDGVGVWSLGSLRSAAARTASPWAPEVTAARVGPDGSGVGDEGTMPSAFRPGHLQRSPYEAPGLGAPELPPPPRPAPLPALAVKPHPFSLSCGAPCNGLWDPKGRGAGEEKGRPSTFQSGLKDGREQGGGRPPAAAPRTAT